MRERILHVLAAANEPLTARSLCARLPDSCLVAVRMTLGDLLHSGAIEMRSIRSPRGAQLVYWLRPAA